VGGIALTGRLQRTGKAIGGVFFTVGAQRAHGEVDSVGFLHSSAE
jgi:hypothetical protein